ncbi:MAG TPA: Trk system potassium transporter TrkA [Burkholderiaceae bacterium]|nr:Trk system potassium transporter TrkA [Burkholderiaceae bacterium]
MKILILGAGRVGESVAESLVSEQNDITVVDVDAAKLSDLQDRFDLRGVVGNAMLPSVLRDAGAQDTDMLLAVTALDETNLAACKIAKHLFNIPVRIARVRSSEFQSAPEITGENGFEAQTVICPEQTVVDMIDRLVEFPEALQVLNFAHGLLGLIAVRAYAGGLLVNHPIEDLRRQIPDVDARVVAIFRNERPVPVRGDTVIQPGDEVFCLAATEHLRKVMRELRRVDKAVRRVIIAGGGNIGFRLAQQLGDDYEVKIIESRRARCEMLAARLPSRVLVLNGDATDEDLLVDENVHETDLFLALTSDDEDNIMSCLLAKRLGARRTLAIINRKSYAELMQGSAIDIAISPSQATIGELLRLVRRGDIVAVHSLRRGAAEALEIVAHGDANNSRVVGKRVEQIEMPAGAMIGAIVRGLQGPAHMGPLTQRQDTRAAKVLIAHHDTVIESDDHVIVFCENKRILPKVEKLFQVSVGFF